MNAARRLLSLRASSSALFPAGGTLPSPTRIHPLWRAQRTMKGREEGRPSVESSIQSNPKVHQMQQVVDSDATGGWEKCWEQGLTPWDLGQPTPIIVHLNRIGALPKGRVLVPGCGSGHDVVAMASPDRHIVGLDVSERAVNKAIELSSASPLINNITFLKADFFSWHSDGLFDLIFDYTFFCAIEREMRPAWARKIKDLLKPDGELITLMFPIGDHVGGPPYKVSVAEYEEMLHPLGFKTIVLMDNEMAVGPRKGREKLARWKRSPTRSFL